MSRIDRDILAIMRERAKKEWLKNMARLAREQGNLRMAQCFEDLIKEKPMKARLNK